MTDVVGQGVIELKADATKLSAGIADAKRSIKGLGDSTRAENDKSTKSIDRYITRLQTQSAVAGKTARETELYRLSLRGASRAQLEAADSALRMTEGYERGLVIGNRLRLGLIALAAAAGTVAIATVAGASALINQVGTYQDLAEKIGDTAVNVSSLKTAADVSGASIDSIAAASVRLTAALSKTDDESKQAGSAIEALGLDFKAFKLQSPVEQLESIAVALEGFADGSEKTAIAVALFGKAGADTLGFLKEYAIEGRKAAFVTDEQAKAADAFSDAQSRLGSQIQQFLQVAAVNTIPLLTELGGLFRSLAADEDAVSVATDLLKGAIRGAVVVFQTVAVVASDLGFVMVTVGRGIGAMVANLEALSRLDFNAFRAISNAVKEDTARARIELDKFQARLMAVGEASTAKFSDPRILGDPGTIAEQTARTKPRLNISGLITDKEKSPKAGRAPKDNTVAQEAKAQLAFELEQIRKASDAVTNTFANSERILDAKRRAGLVDEREYYEAKRGFLNLNSQAQEQALQAEIGRLGAEKLSGKDQVENARKIADAQAKLAKVRENATTALEVQSIQEVAALKAIEQGYRDAEDAAQEFLEGIRKSNARELSGFGAGNQERNRLADRAQIEDRFADQRKALEKSRRDAELASPDGRLGAVQQQGFDDELNRIRRFQATALAEEDQHFAARLEKQSNFFLGASEALQNYYDESRNIAGQVEQAFSNAFRGLEDQLVAFVTTGKLNFKSLVSSIFADIQRIAIKESITGPLAKFVNENVFGRTAGPEAGKSPTIDTTGVAQSLTSLQTVGIEPTIQALTRLQIAAESAATAVGKTDPSTISTIGDFTRFDRKQSGEQSITDLFKETAVVQGAANASTQVFSKQTLSAANDVLRLAQAAGQGGGALAILPRVVQAFMAVVTASSAAKASGSGGFWNSLLNAAVGYFGGSGSKGFATNTTGTSLPTSGGRAAGGPVAAGATYRVNERGPELLDVSGKQYLMMGGKSGFVEPNTDGSFFHDGGIVGQHKDIRPVAPGVFANAEKYHSGGIAAGRAVPTLSAHEVPAILMGGPKGKREEVLHASDPRHQDNISPALFRTIERAPRQLPALLRAIEGAQPGSVPSVIGGKGGGNGIGGIGGPGGAGGNVLANTIGGTGGAGGNASSIGGIGGPGGLGVGAIVSAPPALIAAAEVAPVAAIAAAGAVGIAGSAGVAGLAGFAGAAGMGGLAGASGVSGMGGAVGVPGAGGLGGVASFHAGGIVDQSAVNPAVFAGAVRYHTGGVVGASLQSSKVPAILRRSEKAPDEPLRTNIARALLEPSDGGGSVLSVIAGKGAIGAVGEPGGRGGLGGIGGSGGAGTPGAVAQLVKHDKRERELSPLTRFLIGSPATVTSLIQEISKEADFKSISALREIKTVAGSRAMGGPVSPNSMYQVSEKGPELLQVAGKQYLMTGAQSGQVTPAATQQQPQQPRIEQHFHFKESKPSRETMSQVSVNAARGLALGKRNP